MAGPQRAVCNLMPASLNDLKQCRKEEWGQNELLVSKKLLLLKTDYTASCSVISFSQDYIDSCESLIFSYDCMSLIPLSRCLHSLWHNYIRPHLAPFCTNQFHHYLISSIS